MNCQKATKRSFNNYVDIISHFVDHLSIFTWTFFTLNVDKKKHFLTTYPPHLVQVVFERLQHDSCGMCAIKKTWRVNSEPAIKIV